MASFLERPGQVRSASDGRQPELGPRVALFCHFDRRGEIRPHTRRYIEALGAEGFSVVLVSNSGRLAAPDAAWAVEHVARILVRRNIGYDFGAWRDALHHTGLPTPETTRLVIANDSVYGPFRPLAPLLARMDFGIADVWALTDSWQHRYHLQTYFVAFGPRALASDAFGGFWRGIRDVRSKWGVVRTYEIGLTQRLLAGGFRCRAVWGYDELLALARRQFSAQAQEADLTSRDPFDGATEANTRRVVKVAVRRTAMNPTSDFWRLLLEAGFPFIKRELLLRNPTKVPDVAAWRSALEGTSDAEGALIDSELVMHDLQRSLRGIAP